MAPESREFLEAEIRGDIESYLTGLGIAIDKQVVVALLQAAVHAEGELKQSISELFSEGGTGALSRAPKAMLLEVDGTIKSAGAFLDLVYAGVQDLGGVIKPRNAKNLAIPLSSEAKTPGKWPRTWAQGRLFPIKSRKGNRLLMERLRGGKIKPHFLLKRSVRIKGKGYVERARRAAESAIAEILGDGIGIGISNTEMPT